MSNQISNQMSNQISNQMSNQISNQMSNEISNQISCIREFIRSKNCALNNYFWCTFKEVIMKVNKVIPENLVAVR